MAKIGGVLRRVLLSLPVLACLAVLPGAADATAEDTDPPYSVDREELARAVDCVLPPSGVVVGEPVVLVHGTGTTGPEHYSWNYALRLRDEGLTYCLVTYPDRGSVDQQVSAEYVAHAVQHAAGLTAAGRVDLVGHSQGASMPRWAIKYWPSVRAALDDVVLHAGPLHGTVAVDVDAVGLNPFVALGGMPAAYWQFDPDSDFVSLVNAGDETPGDIDYTTVYARTDELVQPAGLLPGQPATAALPVDDPARVVNVDVQAPDVCPGRAVDHLTIGTTDAFVMEVTVATLVEAGPARLTPELLSLCSVPDQYLVPEQLGALGDVEPWDLDDLDAAWRNRTTEEPPPKPYAGSS